MGRGYCFTCSSCHELNTVLLGVGLFVLTDMFRTMEEVKDGKYGVRRKALSEEYGISSVDVQYEFYECDRCGYWNAYKSLDMVFGSKENRVFYRYKHRCPKCRNVMIRKVFDGRKSLSCQYCGKENLLSDTEPDLFWD